MEKLVEEGIQFPDKPAISAKKFADQNSSIYIKQMDVLTNLYDVSLIKEEAEKVWLYGIDVKEIFPESEGELKNPIINSLRRKKVFKEKMMEKFQWFHFSGLLLFGKPLADKDKTKKDEEEKEEDPFKFKFYVKLKDEKLEILEKKPNADELKNQFKDTPLDEVTEKYYEIIFTKRHKITENPCKEEDFSQISKNFLNVLMGKLLRQAGYIKDTTTRKLWYYNPEEMQNAKPIVPKYYKDDTEIFHYYPAIKTACDQFENGKIFFKFVPKNLVFYKNNTYYDYFEYLRNQIKYSTEEEFRKKFVEKMLDKGKVGIKKYSHQKMKIEDIIFADPYKLKFKLKSNNDSTEEGETVTVGDYLNQHRDLDKLGEIVSGEQPIAVRYIDKGGKISRETCQKVYVPLNELLLVGNIFEHRIDVKKLVDPPNVSFGKMQKLRNEILNGKKNISANISDLEKGMLESVNFSLKNKNARALIIEPPIITFKDGISKTPDEKGVFSFTDNTKPIKELGKTQFFVICIDLPEEYGGLMYETLCKASSGMGIDVPDSPLVDFIKTDANWQNVLAGKLNQIKASAEFKGEGNKYIFFFLNSYDRIFYKDIKQIVNESKIKCPTQVVLFDKKKEAKSTDMSKFSYILSQLYGKLGINLFSINLDFAKDTLVMAYSVLKTKDGLLTSLSVSLDESKQSHFFYSKLESTDSKQTYSSVLGTLLTDHLKKIWKVQQFPVKNIIIYRDGANEKQLKTIQKIEVKQFLEGLKKAQDYILKSKHKKEYPDQTKLFEDIKVCFIVVNKNNDIKFFRQEEEDIMNIPIGAVIDREVIQDNLNTIDFHLNSAYAGKGTSNTTHYTYLFDDTKLSAEDIYRLTYYLTYMSYNTNKSIKVPAPLYFVNRRNTFTKLTGMGEINEGLKSFNISL